MNLVGKILVFFIFVMSFVFMSFSLVVFGTHTNWKDRVLNPQTGFKAQLDKAKAENQALQAQLDQRVAELTAAQIAALQARAKAETENAALEEELNKLTAQVAQLETARAEATAGFNAAQANLTKLRTEVEQLREDIRVAQQGENEAFVTATTKNQQLLEATSTLANLQARQAELVQQVTELRNKVASSGLPGVAPLAQGKVVDLGNNRIEVSIGSDDGLAVGHRLDVYRGTKYLGRVEIVGVSPDRAVANIMGDYQQGSIQRNDDVFTVRES